MKGFLEQKGLRGSKVEAVTRGCSGVISGVSMVNQTKFEGRSVGLRRGFQKASGCFIKFTTESYTILKSTGIGLNSLQ